MAFLKLPIILLKGVVHKKPAKQPKKAETEEKASQ